MSPGSRMSRCCVECPQTPAKQSACSSSAHRELVRLSAGRPAARGAPAASMPSTCCTWWPISCAMHVGLREVAAARRSAVAAPRRSRDRCRPSRRAGSRTAPSPTAPCRSPICTALAEEHELRVAVARRLGSSSPTSAARRRARTRRTGPPAPRAPSQRATTRQIDVGGWWPGRPGPGSARTGGSARGGRPLHTGISLCGQRPSRGNPPMLELRPSYSIHFIAALCGSSVVHPEQGLAVPNARNQQGAARTRRESVPRGSQQVFLHRPPPSARTRNDQVVLRRSQWDDREG